jgi:hypothetical protein
MTLNDPDREPGGQSRQLIHDFRPSAQTTGISPPARERRGLRVNDGTASAASRGAGGGCTGATECEQLADELGAFLEDLQEPQVPSAGAAGACLFPALHLSSHATILPTHSTAKNFRIFDKSIANMFGIC